VIHPPAHYWLRATLLDTPERGTLRVLEDGALRVEGGKIVERTASPPERTDLPVLDLRPFWVMPGLMDLHTHPPQTRVRGRAGLGLLEWLQTYVFPEEQRFEDEAYARVRFREVYREALRSGTTFLVGFMTVHEGALKVALEEAEQAGLRVMLGLTLMDDAPGSGLERDPGAQLRALEALLPAWHGRDDRVFLSLAPRFALACTEACMRQAAEFARAHGLWIQTHLSETLPEVREALRRFPWARTYTEVYDRLGLLTDRTLLAHGVHLQHEELARIRDRGAAVVHCPTANYFLHSGVLPREALLAHGIPFGLGSDVGAGMRYSLWEVMRDAYFVRREPPAHLLYDATYGGARALGLEDRFGLLDVGYHADFVVLRPLSGGEPPEEQLRHWMFVERERAVQAVYVQGRCVESCDACCRPWIA